MMVISRVFRQRLNVSKSRIESLNPLVTVETITNSSILNDGLESVIKTVDLVCVTDWNQDGLVSYLITLLPTNLISMPNE